jgi:hypothetical protein
MGDRKPFSLLFLLGLSGFYLIYSLKFGRRRPAPKGAFDLGKFVVSLKRYPDTKLGFFGSL